MNNKIVLGGLVLAVVTSAITAWAFPSPIIGDQPFWFRLAGDVASAAIFWFGWSLALKHASEWRRAEISANAE